MAAGIYVARINTAFSTAVSALYFAGIAGAAVKVYRIQVTQSTSTTSAMASMQLVKKTGTVTLPTAVTPVPTEGYAASGLTVTGGIATAEGTDGTIQHQENFNILNGMLWIPVPEERLLYGPSINFALKWGAAPTSATYCIELTYEEIG